MLSFLQRAVKSIVYKCACTYISRDIHFAADLVREGFKNNSVREKILEEDIKSHNGYWLGQLKNRIADHKEAAEIAEEYLISQDQYKGKVVESLYNNGQLFGFVDVYFKKDIDMMEKVFRLFSEESGFWDHTAYYRLQQRMYLELAQKILLGGVSNCRYSSEDGVLQIDGWFFPVSNYDKIVIEQSGRYLGEAVLGMKRMDVFENYPAGAEKYAGWFYQEEHQQVECGRPVMVRVYREGNLVFDTSCVIEPVQGDNPWSGKVSDYLLDVNNITEDTKDARNRMVLFNEICLSLRDWMPWDNKKYFDKYSNIKEKILFGDGRVEEIFIEIFSENHVIHFKNAKLKYQDAYKLWVIVKELLINQEYYFETANPSPFIIDGGANIGLAVYYFKTLYPNAEIVAFEPSKEAYDILCQNIEKNNWSAVQAYPYALDEDEKECKLLIPREDCLGASLTNRAFEYGNKAEVLCEIVNCKKLSQFITAHVDFLKLDVEGVEVRILRELNEKIHEIDRLFCEYHYGKTVKDNEFAELIQILEKYGFVYHVTKSPSYQKATEKKTMLCIGERCSFNIWAQKKEFVK